MYDTTLNQLEETERSAADAVAYKRESTGFAGLDGVICLSHLRWDFVYQRPQHLMSRFAQVKPVYFFEEPLFSEEPTRLEFSEREKNLFIVKARICSADRDSGRVTAIQRNFLQGLISAKGLSNFLLWFYTPMGMDLAGDLDAALTVYDCMDELSAFKFAPPELIENEKRVMEKADLVFTGGYSLYEAKRGRHSKVFPFPSGIDAAHFSQARKKLAEPADQARIAGPKLGFCGVIDERFDTGLLKAMAKLRLDWQFIMLGPVVKISDDELPKAENIHYLGGKDYKDLPAYFSGWDIALMPFALNESTRYISPTKTPEYLAAGRPVISTAIQDVVRPYGENGFVEIASSAEEFIAAAERIFMTGTPDDKRKRIDDFLAEKSWDKTFTEMVKLVGQAVAQREGAKEPMKEKAVSAA